MIPLCLGMGRSPRYLTYESSKMALFPNNTIIKGGKKLFLMVTFIKELGSA